MAEKKPKVEDINKFNPQETSEEEPIEEEDLQDPEDVARQFMEEIDLKLENITKAIRTNQKYIKELYSIQKLLEERQDRLHDNFKQLLDDIK